MYYNQSSGVSTESLICTTGGASKDVAFSDDPNSNEVKNGELVSSDDVEIENSEDGII